MCFSILLTYNAEGGNVTFHAHLENSNPTVICSLGKIYLIRDFIDQKKSCGLHFQPRPLLLSRIPIYFQKNIDIFANVFLRSTFFYKHPY